MKDSCPACEAGHVRAWHEFGQYDILECFACGHRWCAQVPSDLDIGSFYSNTHHQHAIDDTTNTASRMQVVRRIRELRPGSSSLLDVGCAYGHYMDAASKLGFTCIGVEPDSGRAEMATKGGHHVICDFFRTRLFEERLFDVVILSHVIEHLVEPADLLRDIHGAMANDALLFVACPNHAGLRARIMGLHFEHYSPPEHLGYFTPRSLSEVCKRTGFVPVRMESDTHRLHVKALLAHMIYLRFLRSATYVDPRVRAQTPPIRFVDRPGRPLRRAVYTVALGMCGVLAPILNVLGGDIIHSYWRKA